MSKILNQIVFILALISLFSIIGLSFFNWRWCDDFIFEYQISTKGIWGFMIDMYKNWDGRNLTIQSFIHLIFIKYLPHKIVIFIWTLLFIFNNILIISLIKKDFLKVKEKLKIDILIALILNIFIFYGLKTYISEIVFWKVGGVYLIHTLFALLWIHLLLLEKNNSVLFALFSIIVGTLSQNLSIPLLFLIIVNFIVSKKENKKPNIKFFLLNLLCIIIGIAFVSFSPGTFIRANSWDNSFNFNIIKIIGYGIGITKRYFLYNWFLFLLSPFVALIFRNIYTQTTKKIKTIDGVIWIVFGFVSILPMVLVPNETPTRTSLFFGLFVFVGLTILFYKISYQLENKINKNIINSLLLLFLIFHLFSIKNHYKVAINIEKQMKERYKTIEKSKNEEIVYLKPLKFDSEPFSLNISKYDITKDPNFWVNNEWQLYFNKKQIILNSNQ